MKKMACFTILFCIFYFCFAKEQENLVRFDFVNQDIQDIVYAVSLAYDIPLICDDTVSGIISFKFSGFSFNEAIDAFLLQNRLCLRKEDSLTIITKLNVYNYNDVTKTISLTAYDVLPSVICNKLSDFYRVPIVYETLPSVPVSLHIENVTLEEAVSIMMQAFSSYSVEKKEHSVYIAKRLDVPQMYASKPTKDSRLEITYSNGNYDLNIENASYFDCIEKLFAVTNTAFCNLLPNDRIITRLVFSYDCFDSLLLTLCAQVDASFTFYQGMYVLYGIEDASLSLTSPNNFWKKVCLEYLPADDFIELCKERFPDSNIFALSDTSIYVELSLYDEGTFDYFVQCADVSIPIRYITLQYMKVEDFLEHLPPGLSSIDFIDAGNGTSLYFTGTKACYEILKKILVKVDVPTTIIGYDLLVLQVQESEAIKWKPSFSARKSKIGDNTNVGAHIDSGFSFNFDIVSAFGLSFATELQTAIGENRAQVYVDTQLQGTSGTPIHFQNTNTFRYKDTAIDPETGKPIYLGVTREIVAGLVINLEGWASGDGMITTKVTASLSRRGADLISTGNPPPTSEKIITTEVRGRCGEPIVLSGLMQNDSTFVEDGVPGISEVPLLGWLFKTHAKNEERTEMIIYLVPHILSSGKENCHG